MRKLQYIAYLVAVLLTACTKDIDVDIPDPTSEIVVEGYIENGVPPYVSLTRNTPYFGGIEFNDIESYFVHDAIITFCNGTDTIMLEEYCLAELPASVKGIVSAFFSFQNDSLNVCIYTIPDIFNAFVGDSLNCNLAKCGQPGGKYDLFIEAEGKKLSAKTTIPNTFPFDSLSWRPHKDPDNDSLVIVDVYLTFPDTLGNYVRYFTKRNSGPFHAPQSISVYNDRLFVGTSLSLPLERGQSSATEIDLDTYGYFWRGDTVTLRWMNIDKVHYDFWNTLENDAGDNPFSSPLTIKTNINGGLGVWGGYNNTFGTIIIPN